MNRSNVGVKQGGGKIALQRKRSESYRHAV